MFTLDTTNIMTHVSAIDGSGNISKYSPAYTKLLALICQRGLGRN